MVQPRLAYAGVVELPQEVCHPPWPDEEPLSQDDITCDPPGEEETSEEGQSGQISVDEEDASDGNGPVETKAMSTFTSGPDIEICFFHVEAKDPEEIDPENDDEHQHRTELAEHAVGFEEDATSSSTLATQEDERVEQGNTLESTDLSIALPAEVVQEINPCVSTYSSNMYCTSNFIKMDHDIATV